MVDFEDFEGEGEQSPDFPEHEWDDTLPDFEDVQFTEIEFADTEEWGNFDESQFEEIDFSQLDEFDVFSDPFADDDDLPPFYEIGPSFADSDLRGPFPTYEDAVEYAGNLQFSQFRIIFDDFDGIWYVEITISP